MNCETSLKHLRRMKLKWYKAKCENVNKEIDILESDFSLATRELERIIKQDRLPEMGKWRLSLFME